MNKNLKPIIKWSGGKSQEINLFKDKIPSFNRYIEPFSGGAALFFYLNIHNSIINDFNFELISLYKLISNKNNKFYSFLYILNNKREYLNSYFDKLPVEEVFNNNYIISFEGFNKKEEEFLKKSVIDKIKRIKKIEIKNSKKFNKEELKEHLVTALQSGLYFYSREIYNNGLKNISIEEYIANWYFVREFCYSAMFRFSSAGKFNVPYGGISYNKKDFLSKIKYIEEKEVQNLLSNTIIENLDFEELFKKYNYFNKNDFIFLDPPYDLEFSQYNKEKDFDKEEQIRLRDCLKKTKANFMIVIKETDFIRDIYSEDFFEITSFDKIYLTNMRNRNNKECKHLIITNKKT